MLYECPEALRRDVVCEVIAREARLPIADDPAELHAYEYLQSALGRRWASSTSGPQLTPSTVAQWNAVFASLPVDLLPAWAEDSVLTRAVQFHEEHNHLDVPVGARGDTGEDAKLAADLAVVRKAKHRDVFSKGGVLIRRQLTVEQVARWETTFPLIWRWGRVRARGEYIPGAAVSGERFEWPREPFLCKPCGCYLCGADFDTKPDLVGHWREEHLDLPEEQKNSFDAHRVEEEVRKLLFHEEVSKGPFDVRGQEQRRVVGVHATHQTQSRPGSGRINDDGPLHALEGRRLGGCSICARSMWTEDLFDLDLFTKPSAEAAEGQGDGVGEQADDPASLGQTRFAVDADCAKKVNELLCAREYGKRWPRIPKHELWASSVQHPHCAEWRWLLHTHRLPTLEADECGRVPPVPCCHDCGRALSGASLKSVRMPKYALANDNWIGRMPFPYTPGGEPLHDMEIKSLARGRMCVSKVIAEPERMGPRGERQGGLRGNTIAFPQARLAQLQSKELPAPADEAARFMSETVVIALAGADIQDLHRAKWAEIRRQPYVDAATFTTEHNMYFGDMSVNAERAAECFATEGRTSDAVLEQAVPILASEELKHRLDGPADTGMQHEHTVAIDGVVAESDEEDDSGVPDLNAAMPDPEFPQDVLPPMNICADELASADLDELQAFCWCENRV